MKLISLNVEMGFHRDRILPFLKHEDADVICLQELLETDFAFYKETLGLHGVYQTQGYIFSKHHGGPQDIRYGNAILSKYPIENTGTTFYLGTREDVEKPFKEFFAAKTDGREKRFIVWVDVIDPMTNRLCRFVTTHFFITQLGEATPEQLAVLDDLFAVLDPLNEFILAGDMNAPRGRETFTRLAKKYKDNIPAIYETSLDQELHRMPGLPYVVDGLFTTKAYEASGVKLVGGLSDHMAIVGYIKHL